MHRSLAGFEHRLTPAVSACRGEGRLGTLNGDVRRVFEWDENIGFQNETALQGTLSGLFLGLLLADRDERLHGSSQARRLRRIR